MLEVQNFFVASMQRVVLRLNAAFFCATHAIERPCIHIFHLYSGTSHTHKIYLLHSKIHLSQVDILSTIR